MEGKPTPAMNTETYLSLLPSEVVQMMKLSLQDMFSVSMTCSTLFTFNDHYKMTLLLESFKMRDMDAIKSWLMTSKAAIRLILLIGNIHDLTDQYYKDMSLYQHTYFSQDETLLKLLQTHMSIEDELEQQRSFYTKVKSQQFQAPFTLERLISVLEAHLNKLSILSESEAAEDCFTTVQPVQQTLPVWFVLDYYRISFESFSVKDLTPRQVELQHISRWYQTNKTIKQDFIYTAGESRVPYAFTRIGQMGISGGLFCNDGYHKSFIQLFFRKDVEILKSRSSRMNEVEILLKNALYSEGATQVREYCRSFFKQGPPDLKKFIPTLKSYQNDPDLCLRNLAHANKINEIKVLLKYFDVNLNSQSPSNKKTALHYAASKGHLEVVKLLVNKGADTSIIDEAGKTPRDVADSTCQKWLESNPHLPLKLPVQ